VSRRCRLQPAYSVFCMPNVSFRNHCNKNARAVTHSKVLLVEPSSIANRLTPGALIWTLRYMYITLYLYFRNRRLRPNLVGAPLYLHRVVASPRGQDELFNSTFLIYLSTQCKVPSDRWLGTSTGGLEFPSPLLTVFVMNQDVLDWTLHYIYCAH